MATNALMLSALKAELRIGRAYHGSTKYVKLLSVLISINDNRPVGAGIGSVKTRQGHIKGSFSCVWVDTGQGQFLKL